MSSTEPPTRLVCAGCGHLLARDETRPFRCPNARPKDDIDHLVTRVAEPGRLLFPSGGDPNPFVRYREFFHSHSFALDQGWSDAEYRARVESLDSAIAAVQGHGFRETPFTRAGALGDALGFTAEGGVWIKDETGNVSGSHKARHLMGIALWLEVAARAERLAPVARGAVAGAAAELAPVPTPRLAIASCGNAALAAAVVARALDRALDVFVPPDAEPVVLERLMALGATITACPRATGGAGDPCVIAFRDQVARGAIPFACQGSENGLTIEGGMTLGYEMVSALIRSGTKLDRLIVQVGGGALASATIQALREAVATGALEVMPRIHALQTQAVHPLERAYLRVTDAMLIGAGFDPSPDPAARAETLRSRIGASARNSALSAAAQRRSRAMWPWEHPAPSVARGILDDETYDWHGVVSGMIETGGWPLLASEKTLREAHALVRDSTGVRACVTGSSGVAGLILLRRSGAIAPDENVAVILSGVERAG